MAGVIREASGEEVDCTGHAEGALDGTGVAAPVVAVVLAGRAIRAFGGPSVMTVS